MSSYLSSLEYENRFYGVNQLDIVSFVKESIIDNLELALGSLGRKLTPQFGEEAVKEFTASVLEAYRKAIQNRANELEKVVSDYFAIDANIVHPDDQIHDELPEDEEDRVDRQIEAEQRKLMALCVMERNMKNIINNLVKDTEGIVNILKLPRAAEELQKQSQLLVSSLENLQLDQFFSNMSLNQN